MITIVTQELLKSLTYKRISYLIYTHYMYYIYTIYFRYGLGLPAVPIVFALFGVTAVDFLYQNSNIHHKKYIHVQQFFRT